ncbi:MAG: hypothetical protein HZC29_02350 [Thaumarchaeota archaeon]|nr:hypothetical protein [Nitrososphaerota archaeon]
MAVIPIPPIQAYAFFRIQKLRVGTIILGVLYVAVLFPALVDYIGTFIAKNSDLISEKTLTDFFYWFHFYFGISTHYVAYIVIIPAIPAYFVRRWTKQYNEKLETKK